MKKPLLLGWALMLLVACQNKPVEPVEGIDIYATYTPDDTIDNDLYVRLLSIDSAKVDFYREHPVQQLVDLSDEGSYEKTVNEKSLLPQTNGGNNAKAEDYDEIDKTWRAVLDLAAKKQYEDLLVYYLRNEELLAVALPTSTASFDFHYFVIGKLLYDFNPADEATAKFIEILENDLLMTQTVVRFAEDQMGYVPPHYAFLCEFLGRMYVNANQEPEALAMGETYRNALTLLGNEPLDVEWETTEYYINVYGAFGEFEKALETVAEFRAYLVQYGEKTGVDMTEHLEMVDGMIEDVKMRLS